MDDIKALSIVSALANGVHPHTGEVFDMDSPYQSPGVIRALYIAMRALETTTRTTSGGDRTRMPAFAGKPWTEQEDAKLLEKFDKGLSIADLAQVHDRTPAGIQARLERHGRLPAQGLRGRNGNAQGLTGATAMTRDRKRFPTSGIYRCSSLASSNYLEPEHERRYRYVRPADYVTPSCSIGDCWIVDRDGWINPGTNVSPVPINIANIGRRIAD